MDNITEALSNPVWWLTAIVVGFSMNLLANYAMRYFDKRKKRRDQDRRERSAQENEHMKKTAHLLANNQPNKLMAQVMITKEEVRNNRTFLVSILYGFFSLLALSLSLMFPENVAKNNNILIKLILGLSIGVFGILSLAGLSRWRALGKEISKSEDALWLAREMESEEESEE